MRPIAEMSPRFKARIAGLMYLLIFVMAPSGASTATPLKMFLNLASDTGVALMFYYLFQPVSRRLSFLASSLRLVFVVVMSVNALNYFGAIEFLQPSHSSASFNTGYGISLIPFGLHCVLTGHLIVRSAFLPRILGVLMVLAGVGYLIFLWPSLGDRLFFLYIVIPCVLGEGYLTLWLLVIGVNNMRWKEQDEVGAIS
ncbi:MAG: DUF4386 domain-containing protein [Steroidobacteraceae bacterium]|nr:DUF4386 domain-containing protein [Steroidobacteraceae bacterium]